MRTYRRVVFGVMFAWLTGCGAAAPVASDASQRGSAAAPAAESGGAATLGGRAGVDVVAQSRHVAPSEQPTAGLEPARVSPAVAGSGGVAGASRTESNAGVGAAGVVAASGGVAVGGEVDAGAAGHGAAGDGIHVASNAGQPSAVRLVLCHLTR